MNFVEYLSRLLTLGHEGEAAIRAAKLKTGEFFADNLTKLRRHRRHRDSRNAMAKASRRRNRGH